MLYLCDERHKELFADPGLKAKVAKWRMKDRVCLGEKNRA